MQIQLSNLLTKAKQSAVLQGGDNAYNLHVTIITPSKQLVPVWIIRLTFFYNFYSNYADSGKIALEIQPGVYQNDILPFKDNLQIKIVEQQGLKSNVYTFNLIPVADHDVRVEGNNSTLANMTEHDFLNSVPVSFELMDTGFAKIKNQEASNIFLSCNVQDALHNLIIEKMNKINLNGKDKFVTLDIEEPVDNQRVYKHVSSPHGVRLVDYPKYLQNEEYGVYTRGLGSYYRNGVMSIYPVFKFGRYGKLPDVVDIVRLPQDKVPILEASYYKNTRTLTVISTGDAKHIAGNDIKYQNEGTGQRIVSSDAVGGEVGSYYNKGRAITTRQDTVTEYQTTNRANNDSYIPMNKMPTNNVCKEITKNAVNDGEMLIIDWHNSDAKLIYPCSPCKYYFLQENNQLGFREGNILAIKEDYLPNSSTPNSPFKKQSVIQVFLEKQVQQVGDKTSVPKDNVNTNGFMQN